MVAGFQVGIMLNEIGSHHPLQTCHGLRVGATIVAIVAGMTADQTRLLFGWGRTSTMPDQYAKCIGQYIHVVSQSGVIPNQFEHGVNPSGILGLDESGKSDSDEISDTIRSVADELQANESFGDDDPSDEGPDVFLDETEGTIQALDPDAMDDHLLDAGLSFAHNDVEE